MEGRVIAERYRLEETIGKGAMGTVWRAEHLSLRMPVAVKIIHADTARNPKALARFGREARVAAKIRSAHVVKMLDHGHDEELPFIVMEWLDGENLRDRLDREGMLTPAETGRMATHVCRALGQAHEKGLIHRDIKPENIFVVPGEDDAGDCYKVLDFGVAKVTDGIASVQAWPTRTGTLLGTPYYLSPEQARGLKSVDYRADLWSLGVVCFECLTGERPFRGRGLGKLIAELMDAPIPKPSEVVPDAELPEGVDEWVEQALARNPKERFESAKQMATSLRMVVGALDTASDDRPSAPEWPDEPGADRPTRPKRAIAKGTVRGLGPDPQDSEAARPTLETIEMLEADVVAATHDGPADDEDPATERDPDNPGAHAQAAAGALPKTVAFEPDGPNLPSGAAAAVSGAPSGPLVMGPSTPGQPSFEPQTIHPYEDLDALAAPGRTTVADEQRQARLRLVVVAVVGVIALLGVAAIAIGWWSSTRGTAESEPLTSATDPAPSESVTPVDGTVEPQDSLEAASGSAGSGGSALAPEATGDEPADTSSAADSSTAATAQQPLPPSASPTSRPTGAPEQTAPTPAPTPTPKSNKPGWSHRRTL